MRVGMRLCMIGDKGEDCLVGKGVLGSPKEWGKRREVTWWKENVRGVDLAGMQGTKEENNGFLVPSKWFLLDNTAEHLKDKIASHFRFYHILRIPNLACWYPSPPICLIHGAGKTPTHRDCLDRIQKEIFSRSLQLANQSAGTCFQSMVPTSSLAKWFHCSRI